MPGTSPENPSPLASTSGPAFITVPENGEERRAFLQTRVALFGKMLAVISSIFLLVSDSCHYLLATNKSVLKRLSDDRYDLIAIALFLLLWAATRRGRLPRPALEVLEAAVCVLACVGYAVMVTRTNAEMELFIPVVAALAILIARAVFIPTSPRRTLLISIVGSIPAVVATWILSYRLNGHRQPRLRRQELVGAHRPSSDDRARPAALPGAPSSGEARARMSRQEAGGPAGRRGSAGEGFRLDAGPGRLEPGRRSGLVARSRRSDRPLATSPLAGRRGCSEPRRPPHGSARLVLATARPGLDVGTGDGFSTAR